jgi:branched-chain amino acid transport system permease protein
MSFDVVASSRLERSRMTVWGHIVRTGLYAGIAGFFFGIVGILSMFNQRQIIVDVVTLGYATLAALPFAAGVLVAVSGPAKSFSTALIGGLVAGATATACIALLPIATLTIGGIRQIFVILDRPFLQMLTFKQTDPWLGLLYLLALGALMGLLGVLLARVPAWLRRPITGGLIGAGLLGLFQDIFRPILSNSFATKPLADLLYTYTGLALRGAAVAFVVTAMSIWLFDINRSRTEAAIERLNPRTRRNLRWLLIGLGIAAAALFPIYAGNFIGQVLMTVGLFILMGMGLNLEVGLAGLLDLGFVAFYAVGAYVTALLTADSPYAIAHLNYWEAMPVAVLCSIIVGVLFGVPVLKVRGDYLAVATMGLGEIVRVIVLSDAAAPLLAGAKGILQIPRPSIAGYEFNNPVSLFYLTLAAALIAAYVAYRLENSRLGRAWTAIRDDEDVAQALGINLIRVKLLAYGLGAAFAGLAGSIFAVMLTSIYPHSFQLIISINILALIIVGGMGSLPGVALGAVVLIGLPEALREFGEFRYLFYGLAIVAVMLLKPEGLWPSASRRRERQLDNESAAVRAGEIAVLEGPAP